MEYASHLCHLKQVLRRCRASESKAHADSLEKKLLLKDTESFWTEIKRLSGKGTTPIASIINKTTGTKAIAELWKTHYSEILNSVPPGQHDKDSMAKDSMTKISLICYTRAHIIMRLCLHWKYRMV